MKLSYRGATYDADSLPVNGQVEELPGKYRGANCKFFHLTRNPKHSRRASLKYRGHEYTA
ncbi:MAG: DUF4278 domain-containing protein [Cyanobacteria bacterium J083]|nr:MAG: DUF4278 domain-containing protein [Cyanobacteria bacterium J083]